MPRIEQPYVDQPDQSLTVFANRTPFPNHLIDTVMPTLKDTEWRLLCVIVRQTLGWRGKDKGSRKGRDWLTQTQLKFRTGRSSEALSRALDILVRKGLVEVQDEAENLLLTPQERRRAQSRLYYRLSKAGLVSEIRKNEVSASETEVGKANTTKATDTKYIPKGSEQYPDCFPLKKGNLQRANSPETPNSEVKHFLLTYIRLFKEHSVSGDHPIIAWGRDGKIAKELLKLYPFGRLESLLQQFFESEDKWFKQQGYSLAAFRSATNTLLMREGKAETHGPVIRTGKWNKAARMEDLKQRFSHFNR